MADREESSPALEAPSDEGPPSKRQRGFIARQVQHINLWYESG